MQSPNHTEMIWLLSFSWRFFHREFPSFDSILCCCSNKNNWNTRNAFHSVLIFSVWRERERERHASYETWVTWSESERENDFFSTDWLENWRDSQMGGKEEDRAQQQKKVKRKQTQRKNLRSGSWKESHQKDSPFYSHVRSSVQSWCPSFPFTLNLSLSSLSIDCLYPHSWFSLLLFFLGKMLEDCFFSPVLNEFTDRQSVTITQSVIL